MPPLFARTEGTRVLGIGGGIGVRHATHGFAWLGLAVGAKAWYVAPPSEDKPQEPSCREDSYVLDGGGGGGGGGSGNATLTGLAAPPGIDVCLQLPGEIVVMPALWWHATCNLEPYTIGIGAQDDCDVRHCATPEDAGKLCAEEGAETAAACMRRESMSIRDPGHRRYPGRDPREMPGPEAGRS